MFSYKLARVLVVLLLLLLVVLVNILLLVLLVVLLLHLGYCDGQNVSACILSIDPSVAATTKEMTIMILHRKFHDAKKGIRTPLVFFLDCIIRLRIRKCSRFMHPNPLVPSPSVSCIHDIATSVLPMQHSGRSIPLDSETSEKNPENTCK